jgi:hypothetical protein
LIDRRPCLQVVSFEEGSPSSLQSPEVAQEVFADFTTTPPALIIPPPTSSAEQTDNKEMRRNESSSSLGEAKHSFL